MESLDKTLVSSWCNVRSNVPHSYIQPPENRPVGNYVTSTQKAIPVIDLGSHDRDDITKQILKASEEYGFFQVINHGVSKDLMDETLNIIKEFHALSPKEKVEECSKDPNKSCKLYASHDKIYNIDVNFWKDTILHPCPPSGKYMEYWPEKPAKYREVVGKYTRELNKLAHKILKLICEGLGLDPEYFQGSLSGAPVMLGHHYPPCPDPSLTLGVGKHKDPTIITLLLQEEGIQGLQVLKDNEWIGVVPIPNAFVVNIGLLLQIVTNGRVVGAEHRAVTNSSISRRSVAYFIYPSIESVIGPAQALINGSTSKTYKTMPYDEFLKQYYKKGPDGPKFEQELL
ncbi:hypothetical protein VNO78_33749 [Psophocarpus tetragonolobus]|uniref:Fe2OG dioxygenase domain-containing protein n=1 Tax=Psophocarpus tetragonolobus TaxID=3891 RepID=A0AAN9P4I4_PSOTE